MTSAFFYGILMHPNILTRVIGNDGSHLHVCPAILMVRSSFLDRYHSLTAALRRTTHGIMSRCVRTERRTALAIDHCLHRQFEDYPAVVPYDDSRQLFTYDLSP